MPMNAFKTDFDNTQAEVLSIDAQWLSLFEARASGVRMANNRQQAARATSTQEVKRGVAVMSIRGPLVYSGSIWSELFGLPDYETIGRALDQVVADESIETLLLRIQSPGGTAFGASELANKIYKARDSKRIVAFADPYAFSAAYWLASAASEIYTIPSGMVGSVGAYAMHVDYSGSLEKEGVKVSFIQAGEKKTDGNSYEPLSERARADIQAEVDRFYNLFVSDVALFRGTTVEDVTENFGKGARVMSKEALHNGMINGISSFEALVAKELSAVSEASLMASSKAFIERQKLMLSLED